MGTTVGGQSTSGAGTSSATATTSAQLLTALVPPQAFALWSVVTAEASIEVLWQDYLTRYYSNTQPANLATLATTRKFEDVAAVMATVKQASEARQLAATAKQSDAQLLQEIGAKIVKESPESAELVKDSIAATGDKNAKKLLNAAFERIMRAAKPEPSSDSGAATKPKPRGKSRKTKKTKKRKP